MTVAMLASIPTRSSISACGGSSFHLLFFFGLGSLRPHLHWNHMVVLQSSPVTLFKSKDTRNTKACQNRNGESCGHIWVTAGQSRQTASAQLLHFICTACQLQSYAVSLTESSLNKCHLYRVFTGPDLTHLLLTLHKSCFESFLIECADIDCSQSYRYYFHRTFGKIFLAAITGSKDACSIFYTLYSLKICLII